MSYDTPHRLSAGGDPRTLPDYAALREELNKLTHPARPDMNWPYAEKLCLSLFERNGVELQTAAWYTLARTQLAGLYGLNEGLAVLEALITHQWGTLWPQPVHARMEILTSLSQRLQQVMRTLTLSYTDLSLLYRAEALLTRLGETLQRLELKHLGQTEALRVLMHNAAVRLENSDTTSSSAASPKAGVALPADTRLPAAFVNPAPDSKTRWIFVAQPEPLPNVEVVSALPPSVKPWKPFVGGMLVMLVVCGATVWGWQYAHRPDLQLTQLERSLAPLPEVMTEQQLADLKQKGGLPGDLVSRTQQQLIRLSRQSPVQALQYGNALVRQAQALWPVQSQKLTQQWQAQLNAMALPVDNLSGWHQGMTQLQQLADRLNGLDEPRGKYMTVSELKSAVFAITQAFNQTTPVEEQLRQLAQTSAGQPLPSAQQSQTEQHLKQLLARYMLISTPPGPVTALP